VWLEALVLAQPRPPQRLQHHHLPLWILELPRHAPGFSSGSDFFTQRPVGARGWVRRSGGCGSSYSHGYPGPGDVRGAASGSGRT
jgi:hypothetical protein